MNGCVSVTSARSVQPDSQILTSLYQPNPISHPVDGVLGIVLAEGCLRDCPCETVETVGVLEFALQGRRPGNTVARTRSPHEQLIFVQHIWVHDGANRTFTRIQRPGLYFISLATVVLLWIKRRGAQTKYHKHVSLSSRNATSVKGQIIRFSRLKNYMDWGFEGSCSTWSVMHTLILDHGV